ncbi:site-2 protease family protein [Bryobacter aggregatus]|uniref:site-2 protease family protein n=1 Tax=Bryobacter aggregatus TaxID=360054 RepID=UPI00138E05F0|nr:site-2 protease family protein [Bryobacter aggregatus]
MTGTIPFLTISGVPVRLHFTFLMLAGLLAFEDRNDFFAESLVIMALFTCVFLHELSHALMARHFGIGTLDVVMYLTGGIARLERLPTPKEGIYIAAAGPATNFIIAGFLWYLQHYVGTNALMHEIAVANLWLGAFNLLPAYPMDGGRIFRSLLDWKVPEEQAITMANWVGRGLAFILAGLGLAFGEWLLVFVAFFVFTGAQQEFYARKSNSLMKGASVKEAMLRNFITLHHGTSIREAAEQLLDTSQQDFPVTHGDQVVGLLSRDGLIQALATEGPDTYVAGAMQRDFLRLAPEDSLEDSLNLLSDKGYTALVMADDLLLGMVTKENLNEFLVLRNFGLRRGEA